MSALIAL